MIITVLDFDDTLFATHHFSTSHVYTCEELSKSIGEMLDIVNRLSHVYIITNAQKAWVEYCMKKFVPECKQLEKMIESGKIVSTIDTGISSCYRN